MRIRSALPCALALSLSPLFGCATILNGSSQTIHVETDPPGATATVLGERHTTPFDLVLSRKAEGAEVLIEMPGFVPKTIPLRRRTTGSTWFNFFGLPLGAAAGGAIAASQSSSSDLGTGFENAAAGTLGGAVIVTGAAFIVDAASGAIHRFDPPAIAVRLEPAPVPPAAPASTP
jgi:hypothetical protein